METGRKWFALMDDRQLRLVRADYVPGGRWRTEQVDALENEWEGRQEVGRPNSLANVAGRGGTPTHATPTETEKEQRLRFARDAADWIEPKLKEHQIETLHFFAAPRTLGAWRKVRPDRLEKGLREFDCDLCPVPTSELVNEARVREVLGED